MTHQKAISIREKRIEDDQKKTCMDGKNFCSGWGLLWPILIFLRRDAGSEYVSGEELHIPRLILWSGTMLIGVFIGYGSFYLLEFQLSEKLSILYPTTGMTTLEVIFYYCFQTLKYFMLASAYIIGVVAWVIIDPWKRNK